MTSEQNNIREKKKLDRERYKLLYKLEQMLEGPMIFLAFIWLTLLIVEFLKGLTKSLQILSLVIWGIFIIDFLLKFLLAPQKLPFIKKNSLTLVSLLIPAFRVFRIFQLFRALRAFRLVKLMATLNRSMRSLGNIMSRRGFGYILLLTLVIIFLGAAGLFTFENRENNFFDNYGTALWWTAMLIATMGTDRWPETIEGRILCYVLTLYGFAVFGYVTATLASFFIEQDSEIKKHARKDYKLMSSLKKEIALLREEIKKTSKNEASGGENK